MTVFSEAATQKSLNMKSLYYSHKFLRESLKNSIESRRTKSIFNDINYKKEIAERRKGKEYICFDLICCDTGNYSITSYIPENMTIMDMVRWIDATADSADGFRGYCFV